jgi:hypothetical protein
VNNPITQIIIVRLSDNNEISYEIRDQNGTYLDHRDTLDDAVQTALDLANYHEIQYVQIQVETEIL